MLADSFILERLTKVSEVYPIVAPENAQLPYSVYKSRIHINYNNKNYVNSYDIFVEVNVFSDNYKQCYELVQVVIDKFRSKGKYMVRINDIDIQYNAARLFQGLIYLEINVTH